MLNVCSFIFWDPFNNCSFLSGTQDQTMNGEFWIQLLILLGHESYFHHFFFFMVTSRINETSKWWFKQWFVYRGTKKRCVCVCVFFIFSLFFFAFKFHTTGMFLSIWWLGKSQRTADNLSSCSVILGQTNGSCFSPLVGFCSRTNMTNFFSSSTWWP